MPIVRENVAKRKPRAHRREPHLLATLTQEFASHETVNHSATNTFATKYVARAYVHTNTVEGYFSIFKRGMKGIYQHCAEKHLHRYLAEFDFRYNNRVALGVDDVRAQTRVEGHRRQAPDLSNDSSLRRPYG